MAPPATILLSQPTPRGVLFSVLSIVPMKIPEDRTGFVHSNVEQFAKDNRARLVVASLTLLRAFFAAGKPYDGKRLGSFETWSETICGAVVFAGMPNPLETVSVVREQDNSGAVFRGLLNGLAEVVHQRTG